MPQLRIALAQVDPTVGDLEGNAAQVLTQTRAAADRGAHLVAFPEMQLTGYPVEDLALRASFVDASRAALDALAVELAVQGLGEILVVVGYLDGSVTRRGPPGPAQGQPAERRRADPRRAGGGPLRQAPPAQLRGVRRGALLRARHAPAGRPAARRGRRRRHLRGPVAGRRPGGPDPGGRRGPAGGHQRLAVRARQERPTPVPGPAPRRARRAARWPTSTWSAARTSSSSTAAPWSWRQAASCSRGPHSSPTDLLVVDLDLAAASDGDVAAQPTRARTPTR